MGTSRKFPEVGNIPDGKVSDTERYQKSDGIRKRRDTAERMREPAGVRNYLNHSPIVYCSLTFALAPRSLLYVCMLFKEHSTI
jgi:hypothetical protein